MPLELSVFPEEVQVAFFMFSLLSDSWDGTTGTYMGKYWHDIGYLFKIHKIDNPTLTLYFMKMYERCLVDYRAKEAENRRKAEERRTRNSGGKNFTHNVQG